MNNGDTHTRSHAFSSGIEEHTPEAEQTGKPDPVLIPAKYVGGDTGERGGGAGGRGLKADFLFFSAKQMSGQLEATKNFKKFKNHWSCMLCESTILVSWK